MAKKYKRSVSAGEAARPTTNEAVASPDKAAPAFTRRAGSGEFNPDYTYVLNDLKRIGIMAGSFVAVLIILSFFLNR
jgi:hypothetical protein